MGGKLTRDSSVSDYDRSVSQALITIVWPIGTRAFPDKIGEHHAISGIVTLTSGVSVNAERQNR